MNANENKNNLTHKKTMEKFKQLKEENNQC